nr:integrase, catalytic region, zinc finger, CCHC-type, peptidase aspartic, catalytic [Tanacetum cinerariifolium]
MTGNLNLLINFVWKFLGTVRFGNDQVAAILGFGDLQWVNILIASVYYVKRLGHNLFSVGQFCDSDLDVAFRRNACFVKNLAGVDLLKGNHLTNLYTINLHEMVSASPICLMARASSTKSWQRLHLLHMDLCGPMRIVSINGKRVYNQRTKKIMKTMNVSFDELSAMTFEQSSLKPGLQSMTSGQISSGLDLTYALSTITTQQQSEAADNVPNAMFDANMFVNPFANPPTSAAESSSLQYVDPSNMHTFYQPYPHEFQWTKDHPLDQDSGFELSGFLDADYEGCKDTFKSTSGGA